MNASEMQGNFGQYYMVGIDGCGGRVYKWHPYIYARQDMFDIPLRVIIVGVPFINPSCSKD